MVRSSQFEVKWANFSKPIKSQTSRPDLPTTDVQFCGESDDTPDDLSSSSYKRAQRIDPASTSSSWRSPHRKDTHHHTIMATAVAIGVGVAAAAFFVRLPHLAVSHNTC